MGVFCESNSIPKFQQHQDIRPLIFNRQAQYLHLNNRKLLLSSIIKIGCV